jgi:hypothetical protein
VTAAALPHRVAPYFAFFAPPIAATALLHAPALALASKGMAAASSNREIWTARPACHRNAALLQSRCNGPQGLTAARL